MSDTGLISLTVDFSIQVLSSGSWPFQQSCTFALPSEVRRSDINPVIFTPSEELRILYDYTSWLSPLIIVFERLCFSQLERSYQRFTAFYGSRHSGRKLTWLYHLSKGELVTNCFKNRYTLQVGSIWHCLILWMLGYQNSLRISWHRHNVFLVSPQASTFQMAILLQFNAENIYTVQQLVDSTQIKTVCFTGLRSS